MALHHAPDTNRTVSLKANGTLIKPHSFFFTMEPKEVSAENASSLYNALNPEFSLLNDFPKVMAMCLGQMSRLVAVLTELQHLHNQASIADPCCRTIVEALLERGIGRRKPQWSTR